MAYDQAGAPTQALLGFCKKNNITVEDCYTEADQKGTEYVWSEIKQQGRPAAQVLSEELPALIGSISFRKSMRWRGDVAYSRPLRWLVALHGNTVVPFAYGNLVSSSTTQLLRNAADGATSATIPSASEYNHVLSNAGITVDVQKRKDDIWTAVTAAAHAVGGVVPDSCRGDLLDEVSNLVESPTVVLGEFDSTFLQLPKEVLVMVMRKHQRYFPVYKPQSDELLAAFVTVANGPIDPATVQTGNEAVLRARFEDATFFYSSDLEQELVEFRPKLSGTTFQKELGSLLQKSDRVEGLVKSLAALTGLTGCEGMLLLFFWLQV